MNGLGDKSMEHMIFRSLSMHILLDNLIHAKVHVSVLIFTSLSPGNTHPCQFSGHSRLLYSFKAGTRPPFSKEHRSRKHSIEPSSRLHIPMLWTLPGSKWDLCFRLGGTITAPPDIRLNASCFPSKCSCCPYFLQVSSHYQLPSTRRSTVSLDATPPHFLVTLLLSFSFGFLSLSLASTPVFGLQG
jgi:hypothetical protein